MKKLYISTLSLLFTAVFFAQSPEKMSYQGVIRDAANALVSSQNIGVKISILQGSISGAVVYSETHNSSTNSNGLVTLEIGTGTVEIGVFNAINWAAGPYFIKSETDPVGGNSYSITGTSQLLSVPYALHSKTAESLVGGIVEVDGSITNEIELPTDAANGDMAYFNGTSWGKVIAPTGNNMVLTFCEGKPIWTSDGKCPIILGSQVEGGIVYKIFKVGDAGYVEGETHGMVASSTQGSGGLGSAFGYVNTLNEGTYNNWVLPSLNELRVITTGIGSLNFFTHDFHWSADSSGSGTGWIHNPNNGNELSAGFGSSYSALGVRQF